LALGLAIALTLGTPALARAVDWFDLLLRGVQVIQLSNLSDRDEVGLGQQIDQQITSTQVRIYRNQRLDTYITRLGERLAAASDRPNIPYTFRVVADRNINAFATMGGFVYVNAGLIAAAENEAELASVIAHEIGHIAARHAVENLREAAIANGLLSAANLDRSTAVRLGVELALRRPGSRRDELEADRLGLATLIEAGYAPVGMLTFFQKLLNAPSPPSILNTHPDTRSRIAVIQQLVPPDQLNTGIGLSNDPYRQFVQSVF
jgi:predicted Zn-dependent protease